MAVTISMLSEKKTKSKLCLNPRGTLWSNDENGLGQKIMEKMGWTKGKGLGKEEQGCREPLRVVVKSGQTGMGYKENSEEWTKHYDAFEHVLANLNSVNNPEGTGVSVADSEFETRNVTSLEHQSKNFKNRVHYKKFTQGKDISQYNDDDLACILGSKGSIKRKKKIEEEQKNEEIEEVDKNHGQNIVYQGSLKDYFDKKMEELKRKREEGLLGGGGGVGSSRDGDDVDGSNFDHSKRSAPGTPIPDLEFEPERTEFSFNLSYPPEGGISAIGLEEKGKRDREAEESGIVEETKKTRRKKKKKEKREKQRQGHVEAMESCGTQILTEEREGERTAKRPSRLNESYAAAIHLRDEAKGKKRRKETDEAPPEENGPIRKMKKLKSTISLAELVRREKTEPEVSSEVHENPDNPPVDCASQNGKESRKKLTSKKSFRELKTELEDKVKRKLKKKGKKCLETISETNNEKTEEIRPGDEEKGGDFVNVRMKVPNSSKDIIKEINVDLKKLFPGSNLASIKGYSLH